MTTYIGTAAWTIPKEHSGGFAPDGSHLERYASTLSGVEINSSFYRDHKPGTYEKWAAMVPAHFRFSVKLSRYFIQEKRLTEAGDRLREVLDGYARLGEKWGVLLVQLPPSLAFEWQTARKFLADLRRLYDGVLVWEPRHRSWAEDKAVDLLSDFAVDKVLADPEPVRYPPDARAKVENTLYFRLHGSPEIYKSDYSAEVIQRIAARIQMASSVGKTVWCIFDNTTFGHATKNALDLQKLLLTCQTSLTLPAESRV